MLHIVTEKKKNGLKELRDGYVLGLGKEIETDWNKLKEKRKDKDVEDRDLDLEEVASDGEGSLYGTSSEEESRRQKQKRRKVVTVKRSKKKAAKELSGLILPQVGDTSVAGEAFRKWATLVWQARRSGN